MDLTIGGAALYFIDKLLSGVLNTDEEKFSDNSSLGGLGAVVTMGPDDKLPKPSIETEDFDSDDEDNWGVDECQEEPLEDFIEYEMNGKLRKISKSEIQDSNFAVVFPEKKVPKHLILNSDGVSTANEYYASRAFEDPNAYVMNKPLDIRNPAHYALSMKERNDESRHNSSTKVDKQKDMFRTPIQMMNTEKNFRPNWSYDKSDEEKKGIKKQIGYGYIPKNKGPEIFNKFVPDFTIKKHENDLRNLTNVGSSAIKDSARESKYIEKEMIRSRGGDYSHPQTLQPDISHHARITYDNNVTPRKHTIDVDNVSSTTVYDNASFAGVEGARAKTSRSVDSRGNTFERSDHVYIKDNTFISYKENKSSKERKIPTNSTYTTQNDPSLTKVTKYSIHYVKPESEQFNNSNIAAGIESVKLSSVSGKHTAKLPISNTIYQYSNSNIKLDSEAIQVSTAARGKKKSARETLEDEQAYYQENQPRIDAPYRDKVKDAIGYMRYNKPGASSPFYVGGGSGATNSNISRQIQPTITNYKVKERDHSTYNAGPSMSTVTRVADIPAYPRVFQKNSEIVDYDYTASRPDYSKMSRVNY